MADDAPPETPPEDQPRPVAPPRVRRIEIARGMLAQGYSPSQVIQWLQEPMAGKPWKLGRTAARKDVDAALEMLDGEVVQPKNRKQARVRAMFTMAFQRAMELAHNPKMAKRAASLLTAAIAAADKIARVDGSYAFDGSSMIPAGTQAATADEAKRLVDHANGLMDLATRRNTLAPPAAPVIDTTAVEVEEPGELMDPSEDAN